MFCHKIQTKSNKAYFFIQNNSKTVFPSKPKPITQTIQLGNPLLPTTFLEIQLIVRKYLEQDLQKDSKNKRLQTKTLKWEGKRHAAVGRESREGNC